MKLSLASKHMNGQLYGDDAQFFGASTDTRALKAGQLFFAWKGDTHDAHLLLEIAASNGAIAAVVEHYNEHIDFPQILVKDSQKALGRLAKAWRKDWLGLCFALTGSNGKTTLKEMIASICNEVGKTHATLGNLNNHIGCPLTLMGLKPEHQFGIIEMGANHPKEISYLANIAQPNIAILNNAGACHLEGFIDLQGVATAKAEIFEGLRINGTAVVNIDDPFSEFWINKIKEKNLNITIITFGLNPDADVTLIKQTSAANSQQLTIKTPQGTLQVSLHLLGMHNICNCLAAIAATLSANIPMNAIIKGFDDLMPVKGRLEQIELSPNMTLINDSYNANPSSLKAGIDAVIAQKNRLDELQIHTAKKSEAWLILGDMKELGQQEKNLHFDCGKYAHDVGFTRFFGLGSLSLESGLGFHKNAMNFEAHNDLVSAVLKQLSKQSAPVIILIKGSFSMNMHLIVNALKSNFPTY